MDGINARNASDVLGWESRIAGIGFETRFSKDID
jgi:hypothetical protein